MSLNIPGSTGMGDLKGDTLDTMVGRVARPRPSDLTKDYPRAADMPGAGFAAGPDPKKRRLAAPERLVTMCVPSEAEPPT